MEKNCEECGKPVDLKPGDWITPEIGQIAWDYGKDVELCRECFKKSWSAMTTQDILNDPDFRNSISIVSPIQREDI